ncbi:MAG: hypothetical protein AAGB34_03250 [Planctomycetota bacterium]
MASELELYREEFKSSREHARYKVPANTRVIFEIVKDKIVERFCTIAYDLSAGGVGLFHGRFEYTGTQCVIELSAGDQAGSSVRLVGTIKRCEHVRGRVHEIGIEFNQLFDVAAFYGRDAVRVKDTDQEKPGFESISELDQALLMVISALGDGSHIKDASSEAIEMLFRTVDEVRHG